MTDAQKKNFKNSFKSYINYTVGGGKGIWNGFGALDAAMATKKKNKPEDKPKIEDPALPPTDGTGNGSGGGSAPTSASGAVPKQWNAIVDHYFPNGGTGFKAGGLVKGCGCAERGAKKTKYR